MRPHFSVCRLLSYIPSRLGVAPLCSQAPTELVLGAALPRQNLPVALFMRILGISAFYHDSACVLVEDGRVIAAAEEERFSRLKHDNAFPLRAIQFCMEQTRGGTDAVAFYEKPLLKFERILETFAATYPRSVRPFVQGMPEWFGSKLKTEGLIRAAVPGNYPILYVPHHTSHAAAAFYTSPFEKSAILAIDGVGEYQTTTLWRGDESGLTPLAEMNFPHSLGLLYSTFTAFLGFKVNEDEYKVMGLSAYGKPVFAPEIRKLLDLREDGSFALDLTYFSFREKFQMWTHKFEKVFGRFRRPSEEIEERHMDIAASIQRVTEEVYIRTLNHLARLTSEPRLCVGGGVALNALANGKIVTQTPFRDVFILGSSGDSGAALGAALAVANTPKRRSGALTHLALGSEPSPQAIQAEIEQSGLSFHQIPPGQMAKAIAELLADRKIVARFAGRMEFGPRALGNRSILAHPGPSEMKARMNKIKRREKFRPFGVSVLESRAFEFFEIPPGSAWPFMNFCFPVRPDRRDQLAAVVHADNSVRIQTVSSDQGPYFDLLAAFEKITGIPCLLNTSLNVQGEPLVETPAQALRDFRENPIDYLAMGDFLVRKKP